MTVKSFLSVNSGNYFVCPRSDNLWKVCHNKHGKMRGQFWLGCLGGGYITGETTSEDISGHNITYIFPNLQGMLLFSHQSCLVPARVSMIRAIALSTWTNIADAVLGRFFKGKLVSGVIVKLVKGINQQYNLPTYFVLS